MPVASVGSWPRRLVTAIAGLVTLGSCSNDPADLYCDPGQCPSDDAGGPPRATPPEEPPWLPAQPDEEVRADCTACAKEKCSAARANCLEDDACTALLECKGRTCDNPACLQDCEAEHGYSAWYDDLWACAMNEACAADCKAGENWGCVDRYNWPAATQSLFPVTFHFKNPRQSAWLGGDSRNERFWAGAQARACDPPNSDCMLNDLLDQDTVDQTNRVELSVVPSLLSRNFTGTLEIEDPDIGVFGLRERVLGPPVSRTQEIRVFAADRSSLQGISGGALDLDAGAPLTTVVTDCLRATAPGIRIEIPALTAPTYLKILGGITGDGPTDASGYAFFADVPEPQRSNWVTVTAVLDDTGETVAERDAFVRAGWTTHLVLYPRSR